jgi:adenine-specific DNA-methyltransferase
VASRAISSARAARESQRQRGQFWTPDWVADAMVQYVAEGASGEIFDPSVGAGAFILAARRTLGAGVRIRGWELDPQALEEAKRAGVPDRDLASVTLGDFVLSPPTGPLRAIVANPPYIRHHRLSSEAKAGLGALSSRVLGRPLDGRTGYHAYFLLRALTLLAEGGRLSFILPADTFEGISAPLFWRWVARNYRLDAVVTFAPDATPFPGVDTNAVIIMLRRAAPDVEFCWAACMREGRPLLAGWVKSGFAAPFAGIRAVRRNLAEAVETGLSRAPAPPQCGANTLLLGHVASVMRGIATGCNDFFFLTGERAEQLRIPAAFLLPAIGRTRDVAGEELTPDGMARLAAAGRPTLLFAPDGRSLDDFPAPVSKYLRAGERDGLPVRPLIAQRNPWYRMERRRVPPFLFAYLGRRNSRFIRNLAGVVPLTCLLCIYPRVDTAESAAALWAALRDPETLRGLVLVGKSYGGGAVKVEPRALERLPLPPAHAAALLSSGARPPVQPQLGLWV